MDRLKSHLTYANVGVTVCLFILLGAGAYAAGLARDSVKSKHIRNGAVKTQDLADGAVTPEKLDAEPVSGPPSTSEIADGSIEGSKLADRAVTGPKVAGDTLTGTQIAEDTLQGIDAATLNGLDVHKIDFRAPPGTALTTVLDYPGNLRLDAQCLSGGDRLDIAAFTGVDHAKISVIGLHAVALNDANGARETNSNTNRDFSTTETFEVDEALPVNGQLSQATIQYSTPAGFIASADLYVEELVGNAGCRLTGIAFGG